MKNKEQKFFKIAEEISKLSNYPRIKIGAIVVEKNRIISSGFNSIKSSPLQKKYNAYRNFEDGAKECCHRTHAEIAALAPLLNKNVDWAHTSIYVSRILRNGNLGCARPCEACRELIKQLGIRKIYYSDQNGNYIKEEIIRRK